ncbi:MAG: hypothetical protein KatS3mg131_3129 [Candidatus Tectimicrobiota bacterium]|nr:MAG: hypothetical protein KatS3mg131_3129 [Candidatus Tectomicrobia bacterium]
MSWLWISLLAAMLGLGIAPAAAQETYDKDTILKEIAAFFGESTEALAQVVAKAFEDLGQPNGYIAGEEIAGAFAVGLRYGSGTLQLKDGRRATVHWTGPSLGFDVGANAAKVFVLVVGYTHYTRKKSWVPF